MIRLFSKRQKDKQNDSALSAAAPTELLGTPEPNWNNYRALAMIEALPDMICVKDGQGRWQLANRAYLRTFNLQNVEFQGKTDEELAKLNKEFTMPLLESMLTDDQAWHKRSLLHYRKTLAQPAGEPITLDVRKQPVFNKAGQKKLLVIVAQDISERKKAENKMELLASAFENTMLGMLIIDSEFSILDVNASFSILTGYSTDDLVKQNLSVLADASYGRDFFRIMQATAAKSGHWQGKVSYRCKNGETYPAWFSIMAKKSGDGTIGHYIGVFSDINEKRHPSNSNSDPKADAQA